MITAKLKRENKRRTVEERKGKERNWVKCSHKVKQGTKPALGKELLELLRGGAAAAEGAKRNLKEEHQHTDHTARQGIKGQMG